jgi:hypothetical protein
MRKCLILILFALIDTVNANAQKLLSSDYRIFQKTKGWELAKAVKNDDTVAIKRIIKANKGLVNITDPKYGQSILALAVIDLKFNCVKILLELGANPNAFNDYDGFTPLMEAITNGGRVMPNDPRYLNILLKYGANPNLASKKINKDIYHHHNPVRPLLEAVYAGNVEYTKILVAAGGDLYYDRNAIIYGAMISGQPDIVMYLLSKGFDPKKPIFPDSDPNYPTYIAEQLRDWHFDLGSELYKKKMLLVEYLKKRGIDYRKTKIPDDLYKVYDKNYLDKY